MEPQVVEFLLLSCTCLFHKVTPPNFEKRGFKKYGRPFAL